MKKIDGNKAVIAVHSPAVFQLLKKKKTTNRSKFLSEKVLRLKIGARISVGKLFTDVENNTRLSEINTFLASLRN